MKRSWITIFIVSTLLFTATGQTNSADQSKLTDLQKRIEAYIIEKFHCQYHTSIEFHDILLFDLDQLIDDHKQPDIFKDEPRAIKDNQEAFDWLEEVGTQYDIPYSMTYIFGTKDHEEDAWNPMWVLLLLDYEMEIIGHIRYFP